MYRKRKWQYNIIIAVHGKLACKLSTDHMIIICSLQYAISISGIEHIFNYHLVFYWSPNKKLYQLGPPFSRHYLTNTRLKICLQSVIHFSFRTPNKDIKLGSLLFGNFQLILPFNKDLSFLIIFSINFKDNGN
jgi:hypothetical protein